MPWDQDSSLKNSKSGIKDLTVLTAHPRIYFSRNHAFAFPAEAGPHFTNPEVEGWKAEYNNIVLLSVTRSISETKRDWAMVTIKCKQEIKVADSESVVRFVTKIQFHHFGRNFAVNGKIVFPVVYM